MGDEMAFLVDFAKFKTSRPTSSSLSVFAAMSSAVISMPVLEWKNCGAEQAICLKDVLIWLGFDIPFLGAAAVSFLILSAVQFAYLSPT